MLKFSHKLDEHPISNRRQKWIQTEHTDLQKQLGMDITTLLSEHGNTDLVEVCDSNHILAHTAKSSGLTAECWTPQVFDLTTRLGHRAAERRLRKTKPKRLWLSSEHPENGRIVSDWP